MEFGVPKEVRDLERRVGLTPAAVLGLTRAGHHVYVERDAGAGAGFNDEAYRHAGAQVVYSAAEAYGRADVVVKVTRPAAQEHGLFRSQQTIFSFLHLSVSSPDLFEALSAHRITAIAYELIQDNDGHMPVLVSMSQIAGRMSAIIAGQLLMNSGGGQGILLCGLPGVSPAAVVILGAGTLGVNAARAFCGAGAQVTVIDIDLKQLQHLDELFNGCINTMLLNEHNLNRAVAFADVLVGAVHIPGRRAPVLVSRDMVKKMKRGAAIIDFSIDSGGCVETSRPTTLRDQTFVREGVIHHCVPNMTAMVARTASYALSNAALPYLLAVGKHQLPEALVSQPALGPGVAVFEGKLANPNIAAALGRSLEVGFSNGVAA